MTDGDGDGVAQPFLGLRLDGLYGALLDEVARLDVQFDGEDTAGFQTCLKALNADAKVLIDAVNGEGGETLKFLKAPNTSDMTISVEAASYRFIFHRPSESASWLHFVYLKAK